MGRPDLRIMAAILGGSHHRQLFSGQVVRRLPIAASAGRADWTGLALGKEDCMVTGRRCMGRLCRHGPLVHFQSLDNTPYSEHNGDFSAQDRAVRMSSVMDQAEESEFVPEGYDAIMGSSPPEIENVSIEQLSALDKRVRQLDQALFVDMGIWKPKEHRALRAHKFRAWWPAGDGTYTAKERPGPSHYQQWLSSWRVFGGEKLARYRLKFSASTCPEIWSRWRSPRSRSGSPPMSEGRPRRGSSNRKGRSSSGCQAAQGEGPSRERLVSAGTQRKGHAQRSHQPSLVRARSRGSTNAAFASRLAIGSGDCPQKA